MKTQNNIEKWLLDISNKYLNGKRISFFCKTLIILQVLVFFSNLDYLGGTDSAVELSLGLYNVVGFFLQPLQDICMTMMFLGLMSVLYKKGFKIPVSVYAVVVVFINAVLTFLAKSTESKIGLLLGLISLAFYILVLVLGVKLRATPYKLLGNTLIVYSSFDLFDGFVYEGYFPPTLIITIGILIYLAIMFNKILPSEFDESKTNPS